MLDNEVFQETVYYRGYRSWWVTIGYLLLSWLIFPFFYALWLRFSLAVRIYADRIVISRGFIGTSVKEIFIEDIRTINVEQRPLQRIFGYGTLMIGTSATSDYEEVADRLPRPIEIKNLILRLRRVGPPTEKAPIESRKKRRIFESRKRDDTDRYTI